MDAQAAFYPEVVSFLRRSRLALALLFPVFLTVNALACAFFLLPLNWRHAAMLAAVFFIEAIYFRALSLTEPDGEIYAVRGDSIRLALNGGYALLAATILIAMALSRVEDVEMGSRFIIGFVMSALVYFQYAPAAIGCWKMNRPNYRSTSPSMK